MAKEQNDHTKRDPKVMPCTCVHEFQDGRYGKNQRLHNPNKSDTWRCTVCGNVKGK